MNVISRAINPEAVRPTGCSARDSSNPKTGGSLAPYDSSGQWNFVHDVIGKPPDGDSGPACYMHAASIVHFLALVGTLDFTPATPGVT